MSPSSPPSVENVKEVLKLSVEQKGAAVSTGELTVYLDGLTVADQEAVQPLTNGNTTTTNPTSKSRVCVFECVCGGVCVCV